MADPYKFLSGFGQTHLLNAISILFDHDEQMLQFFFSHKEPVLRAPARVLVSEAARLSHKDMILVRVALDYWNRRGCARFPDMLAEWDAEYWLRFVHSVCHLEEIKSEAADLLLPPKRRRKKNG